MYNNTESIDIKADEFIQNSFSSDSDSHTSSSPPTPQNDDGYTSEQSTSLVRKIVGPVLLSEQVDIAEYFVDISVHIDCDYGFRVTELAMIDMSGGKCLHTLYKPSRAWHASKMPHLQCSSVSYYLKNPSLFPCREEIFIARDIFTILSQKPRARVYVLTVYAKLTLMELNEKSELLRDLDYEIVNMDQVFRLSSIENLHEEYFGISNLITCKHHNENDSFHCAVKNVMVMKAWYDHVIRPLKLMNNLNINDLSQLFITTTKEMIITLFPSCVGDIYTFLPDRLKQDDTIKSLLPCFEHENDEEYYFDDDIFLHSTRNCMKVKDCIDCQRTIRAD